MPTDDIGFSFGFGWFWVAPELAVDRYGRRVDYLIQCALKSPAFMPWIMRIPADERPVMLAMLADRDFEELLALVAKRWKLPPHPPLDAARVDDLDAWFPIS